MGIMDSLKGIFGGKKSASSIGNPVMPVGQPQQPVSPGMPTTPVDVQTQPPMGASVQPTDPSQSIPSVTAPNFTPDSTVNTMPTTPSAPSQVTPVDSPVNPPIPE